MFSIAHFGYRSARLAGVLTAVSLGFLVATMPAAAQGQPQAPASLGDRIDLVGLTTRQPSPDSPSDRIQFQATVNYRLQSVDSGSVLLFLFENSASNSTQDTSNAIPVQRGAGQLVLNIDYTLKPDVRSLTLVAGVFKSEQKLLAWVSTNPIDMAPWPGRVSFEKAMAARLNGDFAQAAQQLSQAIADAPDTGNYYYWRGDTRIRLEDYAGALSDFNRSIELMPVDRPSRVGRGIAQLWLGDAQAAIDDLSFAIGPLSATSKTPASPTSAADSIGAWAYRARGLAYSRLGQADAAVADYRSYLNLAPSAPDRAQVEGWIADLS